MQSLFIHRTRIAFLMAMLLAGVGCAGTSAGSKRQSYMASVRAGTLWTDLYFPAETRPAPLVVVVHGFTRNPGNMRGWGERLSAEGFVVAVPTMPTWANHSQNGDGIAQLVQKLCTDSKVGARIDPTRVGVIGFSSGGLATFLAAARSDDIDIWVGLDPVDRRELAVKEAPRVQCRTVALLAEPADCNKKANWNAVAAAMASPPLMLVINSAVHTDCESPTDIVLQISCGRWNAGRSETFMDYAAAALRAELMSDADAVARLQHVDADPRVRRAAPNGSVAMHEAVEHAVQAHAGEPSP